MPGVLPIPTIADRYPGEGPLGAVATALTFARAGSVLVATCDLPCLTPEAVDAVRRRMSTAEPDAAVVAAVAGNPQLSLACWPSSWASRVHQAVRSGERRFRHLLSLGAIIEVEIDPAAISDADDRPTLEALLSGSRSTDVADMTDPSEPEA